MCVLPTRLSHPCGGEETCRGVHFVSVMAVRFPLVWEGWFVKPVARSQDFTDRVPTSGASGGPPSCAFSSLSEFTRSRVVIV